MTCRTGTDLHDIGFVERVRPAILFQVARLTFSVDRIEWNAEPKTFAQHRLEVRSREYAAGNERGIVALRAVVSKPGVTARYLSGIKECFATAHLEQNDPGDSANDHEEADPKARLPK
jgi:hypothetical protein